VGIAQGGRGGEGISNAAAGDGANVGLLNNVDGATTGILSLIQRAIGGDAGGLQRGDAGSAGTAESLLTKSGNFTSLIVEADARGGAGSDRPGVHQFAGTGGNATATAVGINTGGTADVSAIASPGSGGRGATGWNGLGGDGDASAIAEGATAATAHALAGGPHDFTGNQRVRATATATSTGDASAAAEATYGVYADATALATGTGMDRSALATALAQGSGMATATARTSGSITRALEARADAPALQRTQTQTEAFAAVGEAVPPPSYVGVQHSFTAAVAEPAADLYSGLLSSHPIVSAAFNDVGAQVVLLGLQGGSPAAASGGLQSDAFHSRIGTTFDAFALGGSGDLLLGLMDPIYTGQGFDSLDFRVLVDGKLHEEQTFADVLSAVDYFDDHAIDLGSWQGDVSGGLDITVEMDAQFEHSSEMFFFSFIAGNAAPVPIPPLGWLVGSIFGFVIWHFRRRTERRPIVI
jgi:hypothetical protein